MLDRKPSNQIINLFNSTIKNIFQKKLKYELPLGIWHTLNHQILIVKYKRIQRYNPRLNMNNLKAIIAFLISLYEADRFSKILVTVGITEASEISQIRLYSRVSQFYIIRWLPGMLTSRFIMSRDFIRSTEARSPTVRYNLKYMRTTVYKLYNLPDLLILTKMQGIGKIIAKEAVLMKLPTIGIASNQAFPEKIAFKFFGDISDLNFIRSFLSTISLAMRIGTELSLTNNFISEMEFKSKISNKVCDIKQEPVLRVNNITYDLQLDLKSRIINSSFENFKLNIKFFLNTKLKKFNIFYKNLNFKIKNLNKKKNNLDKKFKLIKFFKRHINVLENKKKKN